MLLVLNAIRYFEGSAMMVILSSNPSSRTVIASFATSWYSSYIDSFKRRASSIVAALNMSRNSEAKPVLYFLGHLSMMFLVKWAWHRCHEEPEKLSFIASTSPACASDITISTPRKPRLLRFSKKSLQVFTFSES